jgi:antitoxin component YwqK of YwqJK toxin-antitoxin module
MKKNIVNKNENYQLHGIQIGYHDNDQIEYKDNYINGHLHGEQIGYYDTGQIRYKENYINGHHHGDQISYYINGEIKYKWYYINGEYVSQEEWIAYERKLKLDMMSNL